MVTENSYARAHRISEEILTQLPWNGKREPDGTISPYQLASWRGEDSRGNISSAVGTMVEKGWWTDKFGETVVDMSQRVGIVGTARWLDPIHRYKDPEFGFDDYTDRYRDVFRQGGSMTALFYAKYAEEMLAMGYDPAQFHHLVDVAVRVGKKKFASWYTYTVPGVIKAEEDPVAFRVAAHQIRERSALKTSIAYMVNAVELKQEHGLSVQDSADWSLENIDRFGREVGHWATKSFPPALRYGLTAEELRSHLQEFYEYPKGEKVASFYVSAYQGLQAIKGDVSWMVQSTKRAIEVAPYLIMPNPDEEKNLKLYEQAEDIMKGYEFKQEYENIVNKFGLGAAFFMMRSINVASAPICRGSAPFGLRDLPSALQECKERVGPTMFSKVMFFGARMHYQLVDIGHFLQSAANIYEGFGKDTLVFALRYGMKVPQPPLDKPYELFNDPGPGGIYKEEIKKRDLPWSYPTDDEFYSTLHSDYPY